jgi:hypothetical protein
MKAAGARCDDNGEAGTDGAHAVSARARPVAAQESQLRGRSLREPLRITEVDVAAVAR